MSNLIPLSAKLLDDLEESERILFLDVQQNLIYDGDVSAGQTTLKVLPNDMCFLENGEVGYKMENRGVASPTSIDGVFHLIDDIIQAAANTMNVSWLKENSDGSKSVNFVKAGIDSELEMPCITYKVMYSKPGAFGSGPEGSPSTRQRKSTFVGMYKDPTSPDSVNIIKKLILDHQIELTVHALTSHEADSIRSWLENIISYNLWYFTNSGIPRFLFSERNQDYTKEVDKVKIFCRPLKYFVMTEKLTWYSLFTLRELILNLRIKD